MGREEGKEREEKDRENRSPQKTAENRVLIPNFQLWGSCTNPIPDVDQI